MNLKNKIVAFVLTAGSLLLPVFTFLPEPAGAAVANWQQGIIVVPNSNTDLASASFQQSIRNLKATGASHVALVVPFYQGNIYSTDLHRGWNTPTNEALASAIDYAHSQGLKVTIMFRPESYSGDWRAHINPGDRDGWFRNYSGLVVPMAKVAGDHGAEVVSVGSEMVMLASTRANSTNTQNWSNLIDQVRKVFSGQVTYGANSTNNNDDHFQNEKKFIGFWNKVDFVGLAVYYNLNTGDSVNEMKGAWDFWNNNDLRAFSQQVGKPLVFTEIGYRSVNNARLEPWNWGMGGPVDLQEQANAYQALMEYWNNHSYVQGVYWWEWKVNPNAGGSGDNDYTPQGKPAEGVLKQWFGAAAPPPVTPPPSAAAFSSSASVSSGAPGVGQSVSISATARNSGGALSNSIIDVEVYDEGNKKVFQKFFGGQSLGSNTVSTSWTPSAVGKYRVAVGVFAGDWSKNYHWNAQAATMTVGGGTPPPAGSGNVEVWWPTNGATARGSQPFKAIVSGMQLSQYRMFWQVDGDRLNPMYDSTAEYPHKEAWVDVSGWTWRQSGPYKIRFVAQNLSGQTIASKEVSISVSR